MKIEISDLINFCEEYNSIGYGKAKIIELKNCVIVKLYNGGYSENEQMDDEFQKEYKTNIILDFHPITIAKFSKLNLIYNNYVVGDFENIKDHLCYEKRKSFEHRIRIE